MKLFQRYAFKGLALPTAATSLILTGILWVAQSLRFGKLVIYAGFSVGKLGYMMLSLLPQILVVVIPCGFLLVLFWRYYLLLRDHEHTVMSSCGVSQRFFVYPSALLGGVLTAVLLYLGGVLGPRMERLQLHAQGLMSYSFAPALITPGLFLKIGGYTLYVEKQNAPTVFEGILLHDDSQATKNIICGKRAIIAEHHNGLRIALYKGTYQRIPADASSPPCIVTFREYVLDIMPKEAPRKPNPSVQAWSTRDLWDHSAAHGPQDTVPHRRELHRRVLLALFPVFYALWVPYVFLYSPFSRRFSWKPFLWGLGGVCGLQALVALALHGMSPPFLLAAYGAFFLPLLPWVGERWHSR